MVSASLELGSTELSIESWTQLRQLLATHYPPSHLIIRSVMRRELGFVVRNHSKWIPNPKSGGGRRHNRIYLDWYDGSKKTFFMLKYSEYIQQ